MYRDFKNKVAIVTGGSFGIGRSAAVAFAKCGAMVTVADWKEDDETLQLIRSAGGEGIFVKCDVSSDTEVKAMVENTMERLLDCAVEVTIF